MEDVLNVVPIVPPLQDQSQNNLHEIKLFLKNILSKHPAKRGFWNFYCFLNTLLGLS
jgi:hypothetical protein